jgi:hypothetical protein
MTEPFEDPDPETQPDSGWVYVAPMKIEHATGRVMIPDGLFEAGILKQNQDANWAYEKVSGVLIVSNQPLDDQEYHNVDTRKVLKNDSRCTVPAPFFPPGHDASPQDIAESVHENAYVRRGERRHFIYQVGMDEGKKRSCYLLTDDELQARLSGPEDWVGNFESIPKFF